MESKMADAIVKDNHYSSFRAGSRFVMRDFASFNGWRERIVGLDRKAPLLDGRLVPYINLDNAASTPPLRDVLEAMERFLPYYSSVHRGAGFKSRISTAAYDDAHEIIGRFVGADLNSNTVIFGKNTTEAINKLAFRYPLRGDSVVLSTMMERHSNDLPWRHRAQVVRAQVTSEGRLDEDDVDRLLAKYGNRIALLTVCGASNVTGFIQPIHRLARKAHVVGARIIVDAAQLAPHRRINIKPDDDPEHIDFVALSAHKMYAPFGAGALVGPREIFLRNAPEYRGGGTVEDVTLEDVRWAGLPDREEAGSPNVVGAVAMAVAAQALMDAGMESVERHEAALTAYALDRLRALPEITIYGEANPRLTHERVGVISFNLGSAHHALVAAVIGYEGGIGVRSGCFCAQPYVARLLSLTETQQARWRRELLAGDKSRKPGMARISFGVYNSFEDVDALVEMLRRITRNEYQGKYYPVRESGEYEPAGYRDSITDYFSLSSHTFKSRIPEHSEERI
jgi:selenocysteine lyase/cysteine desulfurase